MIQDSIFTINQLIIISCSSLLVVLFTSVIHHLVGKITRWWDPRWGSLLFAVIIGIVFQGFFVEVIEPIQVLAILWNSVLSCLSAVGLNAIFGRPVEVLCEFQANQLKGNNADKKSGLIVMYDETWKTRWFS